jgi:hypothetical protein
MQNGMLTHIWQDPAETPQQQPDPFRQSAALTLMSLPFVEKGAILVIEFPGESQGMVNYVPLFKKLAPAADTAAPIDPAEKFLLQNPIHNHSSGFKVELKKNRKPRRRGLGTGSFLAREGRLYFSAKVTLS